VGLTALAGRDACALSGGERQRLALARAWALRAELLLLDEPCAHLDPGGRRSIEALLGEFAAAGMTLVFSTHQIAQARRLASRVLYLEQGRLQVDLPAVAFFGPARPPAAAAFLEDESC
jgi:tungstate transport system ATP-binding protein